MIEQNYLRQLAQKIIEVLRLQISIEEMINKIAIDDVSKANWAMTKMTNGLPLEKINVARWCLKKNMSLVQKPAEKPVKPKQKIIDKELRSKMNILRSSMFAISNGVKTDFNLLTPESFLELYVSKQARIKKRQIYVELVNTYKDKAISIAQEIVLRRSGKEAVKSPKVVHTEVKTKEKVNSLPIIAISTEISDLPKYFVDAGTQNNGMVGFQKTWIAIVTEKDELILDKFIGDKTNNEGEILAIIEVLKNAELKKESIHVFSDSKIAVGWVSKGKTKGAHDRDPMALEAYTLLKNTNSKITWIPRDKNKAGFYLENKYKI